jgi:hypothetical protein
MTAGLQTLHLQHCHHTALPAIIPQLLCHGQSPKQLEQLHHYQLNGGHALLQIAVCLQHITLLIDWLEQVVLVTPPTCVLL